MPRNKFTEQITVRLSEEDYLACQNRASLEGMSVPTLVRWLIRKSVQAETTK